MIEETTYTKLNPTLETDLVQAFTHALTHEDLESIINLFAPDGEWVIMATGETFRGLDQIRRLATRSVAARVHKAEMGLLLFNVFTNPNATKLCWEYVHKAVVTDQWPASTHRPAPGTLVEIPIVLICEISQGKLVKIREYFDLLTTTEPGIPHRLYS